MLRTKRITRRFGALFAGVLLILLMIPFATQALRAMQHLLSLAPGDQLIVACETTLTGEVSNSQAILDCAAPPTAEPAPPTAEPAPAPPVIDALVGVEAGQVLSGPVAIEARVSGQAIDRVEFRLDGPQPAIHTERTPPYFFMGDADGVPNMWDPAAFQAGDYTLTVTAFDAAGQSGSHSVSFQVAPAAPAPPPEPTAAPPPEATPAPIAGAPVPGIVEAEDASVVGDADDFNHGGVYRDDALDVHECPVCSRGDGPGYTVGWIFDNEWLEYQLAIAQPGVHRVKMRVAVPNYGRVVRLLVNGNHVGDVELPFTGSYNEYVDVESQPFDAPAGTASLRIEMPLGAFNLDMLEITSDAAPVEPTAEPPAPVEPTAEPPAPVEPTAEPPAPVEPTAEPPAPVEPTAEPPAPVEPTAEPPAPENSSQTNAWQRWEHRLTASGSYANPYADVTLRVTYRGPGGQTLQTYGFWDGGQSFAIRAMFPSPGTWSWETTSTPADAGLTQRGSVTVGAPGGATALAQRGALRVSPNGRFLTYADGTPFFWLGDTSWDAPMKASYDQWRHYIDTRAAQGFSVVQIAPAASWWVQTDANGQAPFIGGGIGQWNPAYWQGFEQKVQYANERGLVVALFGVQDPIDDTWPSEQEAARFARQIVGRLYGNHVVFAPSFDKPYSELSNAVGAALREATSVHLITQHPGTPSGQATNIWSEQYFEKGYLDIAGVQTGHNGGDRALVFEQAANWPLHLYQRSPAKPVLNLEAFYDANGTRGESGAFSGTAHDARATAYLSWLSGSLGYTYGARGLMVWEDDWQQALHYPSAGQMGVLKSVLGGLPWWELAPAHERIRNQASGAQRMALAASGDGRLVVAYLPDNQSIRIATDGLAGPLAGTWVSPVTGERQDAGVAQLGGVATFNRPGDGDWLLILQAQ